MMTQQGPTPSARSKTALQLEQLHDVLQQYVLSELPARSLGAFCWTNRCCQRFLQTPTAHATLQRALPSSLHGLAPDVAQLNRMLCAQHAALAEIYSGGHGALQHIPTSDRHQQAQELSWRSDWPCSGIAVQVGNTETRGFVTKRLQIRALPTLRDLSVFQQRHEEESTALIRPTGDLWSRDPLDVLGVTCVVWAFWCQDNEHLVVLLQMPCEAFEVAVVHANGTLRAQVNSGHHRLPPQDFFKDSVSPARHAVLISKHGDEGAVQLYSLPSLEPATRIMCPLAAQEADKRGAVALTWAPQGEHFAILWSSRGPAELLGIYKADGSPSGCHQLHQADNWRASECAWLASGTQLLVAYLHVQDRVYQVFDLDGSALNLPAPRASTFRRAYACPSDSMIAMVGQPHHLDVNGHLAPAEGFIWDVQARRKLFSWQGGPFATFGTKVSWAPHHSLCHIPARHLIVSVPASGKDDPVGLIKYDCSDACAVFSPCGKLAVNCSQMAHDDASSTLPEWEQDGTYALPISLPWQLWHGDLDVPGLRCHTR